MRTHEVIAVSPEFKKMIKRLAVDENMTMLALTRKIARKSDPMLEFTKTTKKRKQFDFP